MAGRALVQGIGRTECASMLLRQPAVAVALRSFLLPAKRHMATTLKSSRSWEQVLGSLSPAHCAAMSPAQVLAVLNLCKLDAAFRATLPGHIFVIVANAAADTDLHEWPTADLAELLICCRSGELHNIAASSVAVKTIEQSLLSRELSGLPLSALADVFSSFIGNVAASSPALASLASELGRRASSLSSGTAPAAAVRVANDTAVLKTRAPPQPTLDTAARSGEPVSPIPAPAPPPVPTASSSSLAFATSLRRLSTLDDVIVAVERAVTAVLQVTHETPVHAEVQDGEIVETGHVRTRKVGNGSAITAEQHAAAVMRTGQAVDSLRAAAIAELLRRAGVLDPLYTTYPGKEQAQSVARASTGSGSTGGGSSGGGNRRHDWRKRAADGTLLAAGVGAALTVASIVTGMQASQVNAPSHRLVTALERASPTTFLHIVRYILAPFPALESSNEQAQAVNLTALLRADVQGAKDRDGAAQEALAHSILRSSLQRSLGPGQGGPHTGSGAGLADPAAATIVAAARRALTRTGLDAFSPAQLVALVELMSADSSPAVRLLDGGGQAAPLPPSPFWDTVLAAATSRPVKDFTLEQRIALAYRCARINRSAGYRYAAQASKYSSAASSFLRSLQPEGDEEVLTETLSRSPALIARLAFAAGVCGCAEPAFASAVARAMSRASASDSASPLHALSAQALWAILLLYDKAGPLPTAVDFPGGSARDVASALVRLPVDETARTAPLLAITLLTVRTLAEDGTRRVDAGRASRRLLCSPHLSDEQDGGDVRMWDILPPSFANGMWESLVPTLARAAAAGFPSLKSAQGYGQGVEQGGTPRPPPSSLSNGSQVDNNSASTESELFRAVCSRRFTLLMTSARQLDLPAARKALLLVTDGLALSSLSFSPEASSSAAQFSGGGGGIITSGPFDISNVATATTAVGAHLLGSGRPLHSDDGKTDDTDLRLVYGRCLSLLARQLHASKLTESPAAAAPVHVVERTGRSQQLAPQAQSQRSPTLRQADFEGVLLLWTRLLEAEASIRSIVGQGKRGSRVGFDPLALSWPEPALAGLRRTISAACSALAAEVATRLRWHLSQGAQGKGPMSEEILLRVETCVRMARDLPATAGHVVDGYHPLDQVAFSGSSSGSDGSSAALRNGSFREAPVNASLEADEEAGRVMASLVDISALVAQASSGGSGGFLRSLGRPVAHTVPPMNGSLPLRARITLDVAPRVERMY